MRLQRYLPNSMDFFSPWRKMMVAALVALDLWPGWRFFVLRFLHFHEDGGFDASG